MMMDGRVVIEGRGPLWSSEPYWGTGCCGSTKLVGGKGLLGRVGVAPCPPSGVGGVISLGMDDDIETAAWVMGTVGSDIVMGPTAGFPLGAAVGFTVVVVVTTPPLLTRLGAVGT